MTMLVSGVTLERISVVIVLPTSRFNLCPGRVSLRRLLLHQDTKSGPTDLLVDCEVRNLV